MSRPEQIAGFIAGEFLRENGINDPGEVLDRYNAMGIEDDEAIMYLVISAYYTRSPFRKKLKQSIT